MAPANGLCFGLCSHWGNSGGRETKQRGQVEGDDFLVTGRGDPACGPYYAPHGKWKNLDDLSVMHFIMTFQWHLGP